MVIVRRIFFALFLAIPGLALLLAGGGYLWLTTSLPTTEGTYRISGPKAPIEILRDSYGVPHIRAASQRDAYFALGYVHAQDRLWQMELMRRTATGTLAAIGGVRLLNHDRAMRTLGIARLARGDFQPLPDPVKAALIAYAEGVNRWLESHSGALPPEFYVARIRPTAWRPDDSLLWGRLMAMRLSTNWRREALRARLLNRLPLSKVTALWPPYPEDAPVTVPNFVHKSELPVSRSTARWDRLSDLHLDAFARAIPVALSSTASNSWAVSGHRTATGKPILAGDPHLGFHAPNLWYLARITAPGLTVAGATLPGMPFHVLGHNQSIGWTMTTTGADTQDLVIERLQSSNPNRYLTTTGSRAFQTRDEIIEVRGTSPVRLTVRTTRNGPVVSNLAGQTAPGDSVIALRAAMLEPKDRTAEALYRLNRAQDWMAFREALRHFHSPVQNFSYGDTKGHIGFQVAGRIPVRQSGDGFAPVRGDDPSKEWSGFIPFDQLPSKADPEDGLVINANNRVIGPGYRHLITRDWANPFRAQRIRDMLENGLRHDMAASAAMQMDNLSLAARGLIPILLAQTPKTPATGTALALLGAWDGMVLRRKPEPLIFTAWLKQIMPAIIADELAPLAVEHLRSDPLFIRHVLERDPSWCDDLGTTLRETCGTVLSAALDRALEGLRKRFGADLKRWRWGDAHVARFRNRALAPLPLIGRYTDIEIATDGDTFTLNRGTTRRSSRRNPFAHGHGATFRAVYDFADLDRSLFIHPTGQSGNPLSPHYRDLIETWRDGQYLTMPLHTRASRRRLRLLPVQSASRPKSEVPK